MIDIEKAWHPWAGDTRLAHCFESGMSELNALFPDRPQGAQEGTIGDRAHQAEPTSDHNPNGGGVVRAWDIQTVDAPFDGQQLADYLAEAMRTRRLPFFGTAGYVIYMRRITAWQPWGVWMPYYGSDPHDRHIHVSAGRLPSEYDNTTPWNLAECFGIKPKPAPTPPAPEEQDMLIVTPGKTALPILLGAGEQPVRITSGSTWHNLGVAGVKTVQIDPDDWKRLDKLAVH